MFMMSLGQDTPKMPVTFVIPTNVNSPYRI